MKTVLVALNAKYIHSSLALRSIRTCLPEAELSEYTINENLRTIFADLYEKEADVYGFSMYIWNKREILEVASLLKRANPRVTIFFGGPEAWGNARELLENYPEISFIVSGEGELTVPRCIRALSAGEPFTKIDGIFYREEDQILENPIKDLPDFENLPFPYTEADLEGLKDRVLYYESSRGCPFGCSYCMSSLEKTVRFRSLEKVKEELLFFIEHHVPIVKFVDRTFNCDPKRTLEIFRFLLDHQEETLFHFEISADLLTEEVLHLLKNVPKGLFQFEIGIQSTSSKTLHTVNRKCNLERCLENIRSLAELGNIHIHVDLIAGLPGEDLRTFQKSFNTTYALGAHMLQLGFLKVLPASPIRNDANHYGLVYALDAPYEIIKTDAMSAGDLIELKTVEKALEVYSNSGRFTESIKVALKLFETPYNLFLELGKKMGRYSLSHSALCRILWEVCDEYKDLVLPLSIDFLLENKGKALPEYLSSGNPRDWKKKTKAYMETYYQTEYKEEIKRIRLEKIGDHVVLFDHKNKTWEIVTETFQKVTE